MNSTGTPPDPQRLDDRIERCRRVLDGLTDKGMQIVEALDPHDAATPITETALAFSRVSRAIRLNLLLDLRLEELARDGFAALPGEAAERPDADPAEAPARAERSEPRERLDREAPDEALRLARRPMPEVVAAICKGFGLSPAETEAAQAPFEALTANDDGPDDPRPCRTAGVPPASPAAASASRPKQALKSRLLGGAARALGP